MSIEVSRIEEGVPYVCESEIEAHRKDGAPVATLALDIGTHERIRLCVDCAKLAFNSLGFMIMSQTGESLQKLVGLKKRKG